MIDERIHETPAGKATAENPARSRFCFFRKLGVARGKRVDSFIIPFEKDF